MDAVSVIEPQFDMQSTNNTFNTFQLNRLSTCIQMELTERKNQTDKCCKKIFGVFSIQMVSFVLFDYVLYIYKPQSLSSINLSSAFSANMARQW